MKRGLSDAQRPSRSKGRFPQKALFWRAESGKQQPLPLPAKEIHATLKSRELPITKEGSRLLRWVLIETAWRLVNKSARWRTLFEQLCRTTGHKKKAIVGVARRLLCVLYALLRDGKPYRLAAV